MADDDTTTDDELPEGDEFEFSLDLDGDEPLFENPLYLSIPGVGRFQLLDRANPPREEEFDPTSKPVSYLVELLSKQVEVDRRDEFTEALIEGLDKEPDEDGFVPVALLGQAARWIAEKRRKAEKRAKSKKARRPTKGRSRSSR